MDKFPQALYRMPGHDVQTDSGPCAYLVVPDDAALQDALANGWHETSPAAAEALRAASVPVADVPPAEDAPPTRGELEQKAAELGIKFDGRWGDKKLADAIAAALKA